MLWIGIQKSAANAGDTNVDALVLDESQRGLGAVPLHLGMPYVHVSCALPFDFSGNTSVCTFDWQHETTPGAFECARILP